MNFLEGKKMLTKSIFDNLQWGAGDVKNLSTRHVALRQLDMDLTPSELSQENIAKIISKSQFTKLKPLLKFSFCEILFHSLSMIHKNGFNHILQEFLKSQLTKIPFSIGLLITG